jgi:hypothetical protein
MFDCCAAKKEAAETGHAWAGLFGLGMAVGTLRGDHVHVVLMRTREELRGRRRPRRDDVSLTRAVQAAWLTSPPLYTHAPQEQQQAACHSICSNAPAQDPQTQNLARISAARLLPDSPAEESVAGTAQAPTEYSQAQGAVIDTAPGGGALARTAAWLRTALSWAAVLGRCRRRRLHTQQCTQMHQPGG